MLNKKFRHYIRIKMRLSVKIKTLFKNTVVSSIIRNHNLLFSDRVKTRIILKFNTLSKTTINDLCIISGNYKKSSKWSNISRHEFNTLCRSTKLNNISINSW